MHTNQAQTLDRYLEKHPVLGPAHAARIALDLAQELGASADSLVIHPGRVLLEGKGRAKLLPPAAEELALPSVVEYPAYSSPEEIQGRPTDIRSGLYSLGCTLFQLLSGEPPYSSSDPKKVLHAHLESPVPDVRSKAPAVPPALAELTSELLAKDPELRVQTPEELTRRLKQGLLALGAPAVAAGSPKGATTVAPERRPAPGAGLPASPAASLQARQRAGQPHRPIAAPSSRAAAPARPPAGKSAAPLPALSRPGRPAAPGAPPVGRGTRGAALPPKSPPRGGKPLTTGRPQRALRSQLDADVEALDGDDDARPQPPRGSYPLTIAGGALGFILGLFLMWKSFENSAAKQALEKEKEIGDARDRAAAKLNAEKERVRTADGEMQRRVASFLGQVQVLPDDRKLQRLGESLTNFANNHHGHRVADAYIQAWAAGGGNQEKNELAQAYAEQKAAAEKLHADGKIAQAYLKINENSREFRKRFGAEIDQLVQQWGDEVETRWKATRVRVDTLAGKGDHQGAVDLLREALATYADGDSTITRQIHQELATQGELAARVADDGGKATRSIEDDEENASKAGEEGNKEAEFEDPDNAGSSDGDRSAEEGGEFEDPDKAESKDAPAGDDAAGDGAEPE